MSKWKFRVSNHGALRSFPLIFWMEAGSEIGASPQGHTVSWEPGLGRNVVCHPPAASVLGEPGHRVAPRPAPGGHCCHLGSKGEAGTLIIQLK